MRVPNFKDPEVTKFLIEWDRELDRIKQQTLKNNTGNHSVLLVSSGLKVWEVTVDDVGVLHTTKVSG